MASVLMRDKRVDTEKGTCEDEGRGWSKTAPSEGTPGVTINCKR